MSNYLTLQNASVTTSTEIRLYNGSFSYGWENLLSSDPSNTAFGDVENVFNGWENPIINLVFFIPTNLAAGSTMTWALWNEFAKAEYLGTNATATYLRVTTGDNDTPFLNYSASSSSVGTSSIPISIKGYSLKFSPATSNNSAFWTIQAKCRVTKI